MIAVRRRPTVPGVNEHTEVPYPVLDLVARDRRAGVRGRTPFDADLLAAACDGGYGRLAGYILRGQRGGEQGNSCDQQYDDRYAADCGIRYRRIYGGFTMACGRPEGSRLLTPRGGGLDCACASMRSRPDPSELRSGRILLRAAPTIQYWGTYIPRFELMLRAPGRCNPKTCSRSPLTVSTPASSRSAAISPCARHAPDGSLA